MIRITARDGNTAARRGVLSLPHGEVETPTFMPVGTNGTVKAILFAALEKMGYRLILGNTYHLYLRPGMEIMSGAGGLHGFTGWNHNFLTDSGGFQVFSLSQLRKITPEGVRFQSHIDGSRHLFTPEKVSEIQETFRSDIQMVLDVCTPPGIGYREAEEALGITSDWAKRAFTRWQQRDPSYEGLIFGIVQGNFFKDLRKRSAEEICSIDFPGIAIGGLSVGEEKEVFKEYLFYTAQYLPEAKPRYVMGIGTPDYMLEAVEAGIDVFDCVYPTRVARNSSVFTDRGIIALKNERFKNDFGPIDSSCDCPVCRQFSRAYIRHLFKTKEILGPMLTTEHNLHFMYRLMENTRRAIGAGTFKAFKADFLDRYYRSGE